MHSSMKIADNDLLNASKAKQEKTYFIKVLYYVFFISIFFPYVSFGFPSFSDAQPWAFVLSIPIVMVNMIRRKHVPKIIWLIWFFSLICLLQFSTFYAFEDSSFIGYLRSSFKYLSFAFILPASYFALKFLRIKLFSIVVISWFFVAILQLITKNTLISAIISNTRFNVARGSFVLSFASEPAYLGRMGVVFLLVSDYFSLHNSGTRSLRIILFLMSLCLILISFSITGYILAGVYLFFKFFFFLTDRKKRIIKFFAIAYLMVPLGIIIHNIISYQFIYRLGRVGNFIVRSVEYGFFNTLTEEHSFNVAVRMICIPFENFSFFGNGIPEGRQASLASIFSMIHDVGFYGILLILAIFAIFILGSIKTSNQIEKNYIKILLVLFFLMVLVDTVSLSYLPFLLAIPLFLMKNPTAGFDQKMSHS